MSLKNSTKKLAETAVLKLRKHLSQESELSQKEVDVYVTLVQEQSKNFYWFSKHVLGFDKLSEPHKKWCDKLTKDIFKFKNFIRLKPRGCYKTTIYGISFILWAWAYLSKEIRFFYTSSTKVLLEEVANTLQKHLDNESETLYGLITGIKLAVKGKNTNDVINIEGRKGTGFSLILRTAGSSTAGIHPHFIIVDDPSNAKDRAQEIVREGKKRWSDELVPLIVPLEIKYNGLDLVIKHMMFVATRWHLDDVINYLIELSKNLDDDDKFDIEVERLEINGKSNYPTIYTDKQILGLKKRMNDVFYSCQYNNDPLPEGTQVFVLEKMHFLPMHMVDITKGVNYCFIDPSKGKKESDYPATIFVNYQDEKIFIFDAINAKMLLNDTLLESAKRNKQYNVTEMLFEDNGSNLIEETLNRMHQSISHYCLVTGVHESRNKDERILQMQPVLYSGDVYFREDYKDAYPELMNQILYYPAWGKVDFPDVVEKAIRRLIANNKDVRATFL